MKKYEWNEFALDNDSLWLGETIFHNANGYIGVRGCFEEGYPEGFRSVRGTYINGFYDLVPMPQAEKLCGLAEEKQTIVNVADTQGLILWIEGQRFSLFEGTPLAHKRTLDMERGVTMREICWRSPQGQTVKISVCRCCSFTEQSLFLTEYTVEALDFSGEIRLESSHRGDVMNYFDPTDPRVAGAAHRHMLLQKAEVLGDVSVLVSNTASSGLQVASAVSHVFSREFAIERRKEESQIVIRCRTRIEKGEKVSCCKYAVFCDSIRFSDPEASAVEIMARVKAKGAEQLYQEQEAYLTGFWDNCGVVITGEEELTGAIQYNMYQLIQSAGRDPYCNVAAKGLSGEGYEGHYFWDTEMYLQPFYLLNEREISKNLIKNRYRMLPYARENARILGHGKGAAYPWRTIMGRECSGFFPSGSAQYHINGDIAYAVVACYLATKDKEMLAEYGCEMLIETARLWMDLGNYHEGRFQIHAVTGPDEYTCLVNNNYYTNVLAAYNLRWACKSLAILKEAGMADGVLERTGVTDEELQAFAEAGENMYLPYDEKLGINPQDDSFLQKKIWAAADVKEEEKPLLLHYHPMYLYRFQICKQADTVLAHFILENAQDEETIRRSFSYYEKITTHDSSLSTCIFSIMAARLGLWEKAYEYLGDSAKLDLFNLHNNTRDGIHTANMGGTYMAVVYGFGGLRIKEDGLHLAPGIPEKWEGYRFRFLYEDAQIEVAVSREKGTVQCSLRLLGGSPKELFLYGEKVILEKQLLRRAG